MQTQTCLMRKPQRGQPPKGDKGERVSDYPRVALRLHPVRKRALEALAEELRPPLWLLVDDAAREMLERLPPDVHERVMNARPRQRPLRQFKAEDRTSEP